MIFSSDVNTPSTVSDLIMMPIKPIGIYWYIYYLVFYYLIFYCFDKVKINEKRKFLIIFAVSILSSIFSFNIVFPLGGIIKYSVFFYFGIFMSKCNFNTEFIKSKKIIMAAITVLTVFAMIISYAINVNLLSTVIVGIIIAIIMSFGVIIAFAGTDCKNKILVFVGNYSLEIYLIHCFITAANRKILPAVGITNFYVNVVVNFLMAVFIPIGCAFLLKRMNLHKLIFRPANYFSDKKL